MTHPAAELDADIRAALERIYERVRRRVEEGQQDVVELRRLAVEVDVRVAADETRLRELEAQLPSHVVDTLNVRPRLGGKDLEKAACDVLAQAAGPLHYKQVYQRIQDAGRMATGKDPVATLLAQLSHSTRIRSIGRGSGMYEAI